MPQWKVVGGEDKGGILVRTGQDLKSYQASSRLSTGAVVEQLKLAGERLEYKRVTGSGPDEGWVSLKLGDKDLLVPFDELPVHPPAAMPGASAARDSEDLAWYPAKPVVAGRKFRVACLHGTASNNTVTAMQIPRLKAICKDKVEFITIEGGLKTEDVDPNNKELPNMKKSFPGQEFYQYAVCPDQLANGHALDYTGLDEAMKIIQLKLKEHQPIDGIFGFSQGSNIATLIASMAVQGDGVPLAFTIQCCGGGPGWLYRYPDRFTEPLKIPSLHVQGMADFVTDHSGAKFLRPGGKAAELFFRPQFDSHSGDHRPLPRDRQEADSLAKRMLAFMESAVGPQ